MHATLKIALIPLLVIGPFRYAPAEPGKETQLRLDPEIQAILNYHALEDRENLCKVQDRVRSAHGDRQEIQSLGQQFIQVLQSAEATPEAKEFVCRQLALIGDKRAVPALAGLLKEKRLSHLARYALERIPGPAAAKALRDSLGQLGALEKAGVINSLGERRDPQAERLLTRGLEDPDPLIADAAAAALGKIGDKSAAKTLAAARAKADPSRRAMLTDACLLASRRLVSENKRAQAFAVYGAIYRDTSEPRGKRLAALTGMISARPSTCASLVIPVLEGKDAEARTFVLRFVRENGDTSSAKQFANLLPRLAPQDQVLLLGALGHQQNSNAREIARGAILLAAQAPDRDVQVAALKALRHLGQAADIPVLLAAANSSDPVKQGAAREALDKLPGEAIDDALTARLSEREPGTRAEVIRTLGARNVRSSTEAIFRAAQEHVQLVRVQALKAFAALGEARDVPRVMQLLRLAKDDEERREAELAAVTLCQKDAAEAERTRPVLMAWNRETSPEVRASLLRILGGIGGEAALKPVEAALKNDNKMIRDTAVRVVSDWNDAKPLREVRGLAESSPEPRHRLLALKGYIRMISLVQDCSAEKRLDMYADALKLAGRAEEKRLVFSGLALVDDPRGLQLLGPFLQDPELRREAASATLKIAYATRHKDKQGSLAAIDKVLGLVSDEGLQAEARQHKSNIDLP